MSVAVVAAQTEEIEPLARRLGIDAALEVGQPVPGSFDGTQVWLLATGEGSRLAREALTSMLGALSLEAVLGLGLAGALTPNLEVGDLVLVERVVDEATGRTWTPAGSDRLARRRCREGADATGVAVTAVAVAATTADKARLAASLAGGEGSRASGRWTAIVDLESAGWCEACEAAGVPLLIGRWVSDGADEGLPLDFERCRDDRGAIDRAKAVRMALPRPASWPGLWRLRRRLARGGERLGQWAVGALAA